MKETALGPNSIFFFFSLFIQSTSKSQTIQRFLFWRQYEALYTRSLREFNTLQVYTIFQEVHGDRKVLWATDIFISIHNYFKNCYTCVIKVHLFLLPFNNYHFILQKKYFSSLHVFYYDRFPQEAKTSEAHNIKPTRNTGVGVEKVLNDSNDCHILMHFPLVLQFQKWRKIIYQLINH